MVGGEGGMTARVASLIIQPRHPELVSGSIGPHALPLSWKRNGEVGSPARKPRLQAPWILKQVQDDERGYSVRA